MKILKHAAQILFLEDQRDALLGEESALPKETAMSNLGLAQIVRGGRQGDYDANA